MTAVELLPVHESVPEAFLVQRRADQLLGLQHDRLLRPAPGATRPRCGPGSPGGQVAEFKAMVDALHAAGIEVILDVVFNHTAEGDHTGPTLCFRGLDNPSYYRLDPGDPRRYVDTTGCGNSLNAGDPLDPSADHGLAAVLDHRDARRRLPVRPGSHPGPPGRRVQRPVGLLRPGRAGPGGVAGQADRRAVGRRAGGQLRRRPVPAGLARMERQVPRHHARLLAQPPGRHARVRHPVLRVGGHVRPGAGAARPPR